MVRDALLRNAPHHEAGERLSGLSSNVRPGSVKGAGVPSVTPAGYAGLRERCHAGVARERRTQQEDGGGRAGRFAEPHAEIEQRIEVELAEQQPVAGFGRDMAGATMIERGAIE